MKIMVVTMSEFNTYRIDINVSLTRLDTKAEIYTKHLVYTISGDIKSQDDIISDLMEIG